MKIRAHILKHSYPLIRLYWKIKKNARGVAVVVRHNDEILLIKHSYGNPRWSIPGGGINRNEAPEAAALRETYEEVGIKLSALHGVKENPIRDPQGGLLWVYEGIADTKEHNIDGVEIIESAWFALDALPENMMTRATNALDLTKIKSFTGGGEAESTN
jgi:ADP-ribose pyrophosphatase YjhB (NUDIX family)